PNLHPLFYPLTRSDLTLDRAALDPQTLAANDEVALWQGWANVTINLSRLDVFLRDAFEYSGRTMGVGGPPRGM
ncbi:hypothetical protein JCM8097_000437, partial [Rhodosporidiobolus ruineniae]